MTWPRILACTDLSSASDAASREALRWAVWCDATVPSLAQLVLGQVHASVLRRAPCSVLVVKPR